jgi:hypothetical protein
LFVCSCLKISLNRERTRIEMTLRENVSSAEIFLATLLVHMKFLNPPGHHSEIMQKRKDDMERVVSNITLIHKGSESDDMIKFLAVVRKLGIDIM